MLLIDFAVQREIFPKDLSYFVKANKL